MHRSLIFLFGFLLSVLGYSQTDSRQKATSAQAHFEKVSTAGQHAEAIKEALLPILPNFQDEDFKLILQHEITSPLGKHYSFQQQWKGIPIYGTEVKVNCDLEGTIRSYFDFTYHFSIDEIPTFPSKKALSAFQQSVEFDTSTIARWETENVLYVNTKEEPVAVKRIRILNDSEYFEALLNEQGEQVFFRDLLKYRRSIDGQDSVINASVFLPDPLTTANQTYVAPYIDDGDKNNPSLDAEMVSVQVPVDFENGIFSLKGPYVTITNYRNTAHQPATSTTPFFTYNRSDQEFEDINVYYHIHAYQTYIQSLGFTNLANYSIHAETHAYEADNSVFVSGFSPPRLNFGEGGVDDAEDADVVIHEYGHAIQFSAAPNAGQSAEGQALDEGNSDYLAASYSRDLNPFNWERVFSWDGHNEFYDGRVINSTKKYPQDLGSSIHKNGEIWSSALMEIWSIIGREATDKILLQSLYNYPSHANMSEAAMLFILTDSSLNNGANYTTICDVFNARGFSTICNDFVGISSTDVSPKLALLNTLDFAGGGNAVLQTQQQKGFLSLTDITGKVRWEKVITATDQVVISAADLPAGVYVLSFISSNERHTYKLVRH